MRPTRPPRYPLFAAAIATDGRPKYAICVDAGYSPNVLGGLQSGRIPLTEEHVAGFARALGADDLFDVDNMAVTK
jgi:hypothetical protein